jgi:hypothetical protein
MSIADRGEEIAKSIALIEDLGPTVTWSFGTITNDMHIMHPRGTGVMVAINGPGSPAHRNPIIVVEKSSSSLTDATVRAIERYKHRRDAVHGA